MSERKETGELTCTPLRSSVQWRSRTSCSPTWIICQAREHMSISSIKYYLVIIFFILIPSSATNVYLIWCSVFCTNRFLHRVLHFKIRCTQIKSHLFSLPINIPCKIYVSHGEFDCSLTWTNCSLILASLHC